MKRLDASVIITIVVCVFLNMITPFIAYTMMNSKLSEDGCNGKKEPNFLISEFKFEENSIGGLYVSMENPTTQYWFRIASLNSILPVFWIIFVVCVYECCNSWSNPRNNSHRFKIIMVMFGLMGFVSSMTYLYGGPTFKNEFLGMNDSRVYVKSTIGYQQVPNLLLYKTYGDDSCGGTPIATSIDMPILSRVVQRPVVITVPVRSGGNRNDPCKKVGLKLVANSNFRGITGISWQLAKQGPWTYDVLETRKWDIIQGGLELKPECLKEMEEIIVIKSGNLLIPIVYVVAILLIFTFESDEVPVRNPRENPRENREIERRNRLPPPVQTRRISTQPRQSV